MERKRYNKMYCIMKNNTEKIIPVFYKHYIIEITGLQKDRAILYTTINTTGERLMKSIESCKNYMEKIKNDFYLGYDIIVYELEN